MSESHDPTAPVTVRLFGPFSLQSATLLPKLRTKKTQILAALLAVKPGTLYRRDQIAIDLWPEATVSGARQSLRMALTNLRSVLGSESLINNDDTVGFSPAHVNSDVAEFERRFAQADFAGALNLVEGGFAADIDHPWLTAERFRIQESLAQAAVSLADSATDDESRRQAVSTVQRILVLTGCREDLHIALMKLCLAQGLPSLAIAQFEKLEEELEELWGEPPSSLAYSLLENAPRPEPVRRPLAADRDRTGLVGRSELFHDIRSRFVGPPGHLVTLTGTGGSGKTALARALVRDMVHDGRKAMFFDLTPVTSRQSAVAKILDDLGLPGIAPTEAMPALQKALRQEPKLYVFDNLEQLQGDASALIGELRAAIPGLQILATSRSPLGLEGEERIDVGPLSVPPLHAPLSELRTCASVCLFEHRAKLANPSFEITADNADSVAALCRLLDGLPLQIILAASHVVVRSPAQIISEVQMDLRFVDAPSSDEGRHQSARGLVKWSLDLMEPAVRDAALRLSVIQGAFSEADAEGLVKTSGTRDLLRRLVESSLLNADSSGVATTFWFYESVRMGLMQILRAEGLLDAAHAAFLDHSLAVLQARESDPKLAGWQRLRTTFTQGENILNVLRAAPSVDSRVAELAVLAQPAFSAYGGAHDLAGFLIGAFRDESGTIAPSLRAKAGAAWVNSISNAGDINESQRVLDRAMELAAGDVEAELAVRTRRAINSKARQEYDAAGEDLDWIIENAKPEDHATQAWALYSQGLVACCVNKRKESLALHQRAAAEAQSADDDQLRIRILYDLGSELAHQGDFEGAVERFQLAIALSQKLGSQKLEGLTLWQYGDALLSMGRPADAVAHLRTAIRLVYESAYAVAEKWIFIKAAEAAYKCGHPKIALGLLAKGVTSRESEDRPLADYEQEDVDRLVGPLKSAFGIEEFYRLWHQASLRSWQEHWDSFNEFEPKPTL